MKDYKQMYERMKSVANEALDVLDYQCPTTDRFRRRIAEIDATPEVNETPFSCNAICDDCGMNYNLAHNPKGCPVCSIDKAKPPAQSDALKNLLGKLCNHAASTMNRLNEANELWEALKAYEEAGK